MKKSKYIIVSLLSAMALTSCSLFKDDDIVVENHFNAKGQVEEQKEAEAKIGDVESQRVDDVPNTLVFKNIVYSNMEGNKIENTYKTLPAPYNVNNKEDYTVDKNNNNFDLYVPDAASKTDDINVVLFIHGGAWISGLKTHVNPYVKKFAAEGYVAATIEYTLLNQDMNDPTLSIFRDLDEIDACITTMKQSLKSLGFNESKLHLVLGGASSGAHLAMLYAYSRGAGSDIPLKFLIDVVGPTDIKESVWKKFKDADDRAADDALRSGSEQQKPAHLDALPVAGMTYYWNEYQTMRIANGMCGLPYTLQEIKDSTDEFEEEVTDHSSPIYTNLVDSVGCGEDLLSVTYHMTAGNKLPMLCAYAGNDQVVGVSQFANLEAKMIDVGTEYEFFYFKNCGHVDLDTDTTTYNAFIAKILNWMATK